MNLEDSGIPSELMVQGDEEFQRKYRTSLGGTITTLLPGRYLQAVSRMLPIFSKVVELLKDIVPDLMIVICMPLNKHVEHYVHRAAQAWPVSNILIPGESSHLKYSSFKIVRLPCVVAYLRHFLIEFVIYCLAQTPYRSLPNILLNSDVIPEVPSNARILKNEVIRMEDIREKQMDASAKVFQLLSPSEGSAGLSGLQESSMDEHSRNHKRENTPQMAMQ
ncbi:hypothetical protein Syun_009818 [Stephania yunnanensis]|uniref:lipid-A-disaccharide synthase n=1 Tax=Stephania yunnanensis TaxID=152371 RepID=A0AAP0PR13_9MAGN